MRSSPSAGPQSSSGGTGLYLRAALADLDVPPAVAPEVRARIAAEVDADRDAAHRRLEGIDPAAATAVHPHDRKRLIRALELAETGTSLVVGRDRLWSTETRRPTAVLGLQVDAAVLEQRIRARTVEMFTRGVVDEVRSALIAGVSRTAAKTLGLEEIARLGPDAARADRRADAPLRGVPAEVDASDPWGRARRRKPATGRRRRGDPHAYRRLRTGA